MKRARETYIGVKDPVIASLVLPLDAIPVRFSDEFTSSETAIAHPKARIPFKWGQNGGNFSATTQILPITDTFFALFRDPLRAMIIYMQNPGKAGPARAIAAYLWGSLQGVFTFPLANITETLIRPTYAVPNVTPIGSATYGPLSDWQPHGNEQWAGIGTSGYKYMWIDAVPIGATLANNIDVTFWNADNTPYVLSDDEYYINVFTHYYGADILLEQDVSSAGDSNIPINLPGSAYYRIEVSSRQGLFVTPPPAYVRVTGNSSCDVFAHLPLPQISQNSNSIQSIRINSASVWLENIAAVLQKQGKCAITQVGKNESWSSYALNAVVGQTAFEKLLSTADEKDFQLQDGEYAFLRPTDSKDYQMESPFLLGNSNQWSTAGFPIIEDSEFIVGMATTTNIPTASDCYLKYDYHVEFATNNNWFFTATPSLAPEVWKNAFIRLRKMRQFFSNASHYRDIIDDLAFTVKSFAPMIGMLGAGAVSGM